MLFSIEAEKSHDLTLSAIQRLLGGKLGSRFRSRVPDNPVRLMGLDFPNPVGLAAGLDKNGDYMDGLGNLGFGFLEIGTVTPRPQPGNPQPRMFRLPEDHALINRMGFNNKGVDYLVERVAKRRYRGVLGINIGKNKDTPNNSAIDDYLTCLTRVYPHADYITINISSPNTPGLRDLQHGKARRELFVELINSQSQLQTQHQRKVPLLVKIAPDMTDIEIDDFANDVLDTGINGVIATNTTNSRDGLTVNPSTSSIVNEAGGLSGQPLGQQARAVQTRLGTRLAGNIPLIGVGGIHSADDGMAGYKAGADLLQIYTGFIYQGPALIRQLAALKHPARNHGDMP